MRTDWSTVRGCLRPRASLLSLLAAGLLLLQPLAAHAQVANGHGGQAGVNQPIGKAQPLPEYQIEQVGAWGGEVGAFVKDGDIGYVGAGQRLVVLDMSDLSNLVELGSVRLESVVRDFKIRDGYAYVVTQGLGTGHDAPGSGFAQSGFLVVDVHDPSAPQVVWGNHDPLNPQQGGFHGEGIELYGDLALLRGSGLIAADISDPLNPVMVANNDMLYDGLPGHYINEFHDFAVQGDFLYAASKESFGFFRVYDLSTLDPSVLPMRPPLVGSVAFGLSREVTGVAVQGDWAYVAVIDESDSPPGNERQAEIWAIDISDPTAPIKMGTFDDFPQHANGPRALGDLSVSDGRLYVSNDGGTDTIYNSLTVLDVAADPSQPAQIGIYNTHGSVYGVVGEGDIAYLMDHGEGLIAVDTIHAGAPSRLGNFHSPATLGILRKRGDLMYVSDYWNGMTILDVSDRADPRVVGVYQTGPGDTRNAGPALDNDGYAYLAAGSGLEAIDVSDPSSPVRVGRLQLGGVSQINTLELVEIDDRKIVIAHASPFVGCYLLFSFDVTDPTDIVQLDVTCTGSREPVRLALGEPGTLYHTGLLSDDTGAFHHIVAVDYTDPSALRVSPLGGTTLESPNDDSITAVYNPEDQMLWHTVGSSTSSDDCLQAIDLSDPADPAPAGTTRWWVNPGGIAVSPHGLVMLGQSWELLGHGICSILMSTDVPSSPRLLGSAMLPFPNASGAGSPQSDVVADGSGVYVAKSFQTGENSNTGLAIFDVHLTVDRNRDGRINTQDLAHFLKEARSMSPGADLNGDGRIDQNDIALFVRMYLG